MTIGTRVTPNNHTPPPKTSGLLLQETLLSEGSLLQYDLESHCITSLSGLRRWRPLRRSGGAGAEVVPCVVDAG